MTAPKSPKPSTTRAAGSEPAPSPPKPDNPKPPPDNRDELLAQLVRLANSVETLAQRTDDGPSTTADPTPTDPDVAIQLTVDFDYTFLGEVLGRFGFAVAKVGVQPDNDVLVFTPVIANAVVRLRAANNVTDVQPIPGNGRVPLKDELRGQHIDAIVVVDAATGRIPLAIGNCVDTDPIFSPGVR